jgi:uncharacterized membrane protein YuzA (DUF378 family)
MNLIDYVLPIIGAGYYLLILKGVVKLPPNRQERFDNFVRGRETMMSIIAYAIIGISIILAAKNLLSNNS